MAMEPMTTATSPPLGLGLSADEVDVAGVLIFLKENSASTGTRGTPSAWEGASAAFAVSGSSSPRSVNAPPAPASAPAQPAVPRGAGARGDAEEDEDEQEVAGSQRRTKRCRPIAEIYRATQRIGRRGRRSQE